MKNILYTTYQQIPNKISRIINLKALVFFASKK